MLYVWIRQPDPGAATVSRRPPGKVTDVHSFPHDGSGETWAKIILFGEHSVVYGHPALALPLHSLRMHADVRPIAGPTVLRSLGYAGPLADAGPRFAGVARAVEVALDYAGHPGAGLDIATSSDFPPERGLGSSAAAAGAVIRAVLNAFDIEAGGQELFELTQEAERVAHGRSSGLDAVATAARGPIHFHSGRMNLVRMDLAAHIVVADSGIHGSTRSAVSGVRRRYEHDHEHIGETLVGLGDLARRAVRDVRAGDALALGDEMNTAQRLLRRLGVSNSRLDALNRAAIEAGALGAKLTGGGLGGCVIALAGTEMVAERVRSALRRAGAVHTWVHSPQPTEVSA